MGSILGQDKISSDRVSLPHNTSEIEEAYSLDDEELLEKAKAKLDGERINMDKLLSELNREKMNLQRLNNDHIEAQELAEKARLSYQERKDKFEERLKTQQDFIERNNIFLNTGKKMKAFIDRYQTTTRKKDANKPIG
jgi:DNA mismatch repair protein MutS2